MDSYRKVMVFGGYIRIFFVGRIRALQEHEILRQYLSNEGSKDDDNAF